MYRRLSLQLPSKQSFSRQFNDRTNSWYVQNKEISYLMHLIGVDVRQLPEISYLMHLIGVDVRQLPEEIIFLNKRNKYARSRNTTS